MLDNVTQRMVTKRFGFTFLLTERDHFRVTLSRLWSLVWFFIKRAKIKMKCSNLEDALNTWDRIFNNRLHGQVSQCIALFWVGPIRYPYTFGEVALRISRTTWQLLISSNYVTPSVYNPIGTDTISLNTRNWSIYLFKNCVRIQPW